jgi:hypothetical protein
MGSPVDSMRSRNSNSDSHDIFKEYNIITLLLLLILLHPFLL